MSLVRRITTSLVSSSLDLFGIEIEENLIQFQNTRKDVEGDLTLVLFPLVKLLKRNLNDLGHDIGSYLSREFTEIESFEIVNGFLNIHFSSSYFIKSLEEINKMENFGFQVKGSRGLMMVEYSSPNTNKPLHLGHLRNIFLGDAVASLLKARGHEVIRTQVINDRGIHICKSMLAWKLFSPVNEIGERETPQNSHIKGDKLVGKYYVEFDKRLNEDVQEQISQWQLGEGFSSDGLKKEFNDLCDAKSGKDEKAIKAIEAKINDLAKRESALMKQAKEMLIKWEARDPEVYLLWSTMNGWVYDGFASTYEKMGVQFDQLYYESNTFLLGRDQVLQGLKDGVFYRKEDGSVWIDLSDCGLDEKLVLRADGTAVYMTQDIGTAIERFSDYPNLTGMVYTVGNEQDYHFKVLFLILKKLGYAWSDNCHHLSYGMVDLPSGKMKSREGTVVDADDLMAEVIAQATQMTNERGHIETMTPMERSELCELIGLGGLKYYLLKVDPKKRMMFNPEESIDLTGNTGPFIQYAHARISSLLAKTTDNVHEALDGLDSLLKEEKEILKLLFNYPEVIDESALSLSPALLSNYIFELVKSYNHFYQTVPILSEEIRSKRIFRLKLSNEVRKVISSGLNVLGIKAPYKM